MCPPPHFHIKNTKIKKRLFYLSFLPSETVVSMIFQLPDNPKSYSTGISLTDIFWTIAPSEYRVWTETQEDCCWLTNTWKNRDKQVQSHSTKTLKNLSVYVYQRFKNRKETLWGPDVKSDILVSDITYTPLRRRRMTFGKRYDAM